jgi:uncharacterized protein (TIGR00730 family)
MQNICVYCASSTQIDASFFDAADRLGKILAHEKLTIVCGGGSLGLMAKLADSALDAGGKVIGVIPTFMCDENWHHKNLSELIVTENMHERKEKMAIMSDAAIALPGGCGTLEELLEVITWKQLGLYTKPIVIVNTNGYYDALITMLHRAVEDKFMRELHRDLWIVVSEPEEVIDAIKNAPDWDVNQRKFAAI